MMMQTMIKVIIINMFELSFFVISGIWMIEEEERFGSLEGCSTQGIVIVRHSYISTLAHLTFVCFV